METAQGWGCRAESEEVTNHTPQCLPRELDSSGGHWKAQGSVGGLGSPLLDRQEGSVGVCRRTLDTVWKSLEVSEQELIAAFWNVE